MSSTEELKLLQISLQDISLATNGFAKQNFIAKGGFGNVYKGISEKHGIIAVKRLNPLLQQGEHEFQTEITFLSVHKHENIVTLHGFCDEEGEKILVYKYESKGSLDKLLKGKDLTWVQRLQICLDAARGLRYLHDDVGPKHRILHRDIKSGNILLDENFRAKVSDFGLCREGPANVPTTYVISKVCGTPGYVDPEYINGGLLTQKSDVFSFGVVLFEVLCGKLACTLINGLLFNIWVQKHYKEQTLDKIIHHDLQAEIKPASLLTFSAIAYKCLQNGAERPTMKNVVEQLQKALDNQQATSGPRSNVYNASSGKYDSHFDALQIQSRYIIRNKSATRTTASSSHSTPATSHPREFDVFVSFRGADTRDSFIDHLYFALLQQQIRTFKDTEHIPIGERIVPIVMKAIEESVIAVIIFSENYSSSTWCLDELVQVMKCREERGLIVVPVFYNVEPNDVRKQRRYYGDAFVKHEITNKNKVKSWRKALTEATDNIGFDVTNRGEAETIKEIVDTISVRLISLRPSLEVSPQTSVDTYVIGMGTRVQRFKSRLQFLSGGAQMVAICGIWGCGKSTLASSVYEDIRLDFEGYCFIKDVRAESRVHGLKMLQEKILSTLLRYKVVLNSIEEGIDMMETSLRHNSCLIVLDNVDHIDHVNMLAGSHGWFGDGSLIIMTTRNKDLAEACDVDMKHNVEMLDVDEAINLFSHHAFETSTPIQDFREVSLEMVSKLGGHPSALMLLGSFLRGKGMRLWMRTLARLEDIPVDEILEKFNISDDGVIRNVHSWLASMLKRPTKKRGF